MNNFSVKKQTFDWKTFLICIAVPLLVGLIASLISGNSMEQFQALTKPPLAPPAWLFPVAWTILYILMGIASFLIVTSGCSSEEKQDAISIYAVQLLFNFLWTIIFFNFGLYLPAFVWLVILWIFIVITMMKFYKCSALSAYLLFPYLIWVSFAGYLNLAIALLN